MTEWTTLTAGGRVPATRQRIEQLGQRRPRSSPGRRYRGRPRAGTAEVRAYGYGWDDGTIEDRDHVKITY